MAEKKLSIIDVAKKAGVSTATVSRDFEWERRIFKKNRRKGFTDR